MAGSTARTASTVAGVNKTTASSYFHRLRLLIHDSSKHLEILNREIEVNESYFGGVRKDKRRKRSGR